MPKSKVSVAEFRAEAWRGVKHLMAHFNIARPTVYGIAKRNDIKLPYAVGLWSRDGRYEGFNSKREPIRAFLDRTGVNDVAARANDELILAAIRLRHKGVKHGQLAVKLGLGEGEMRRVFPATIAVRAADVKESGEPAGRVMAEYW